jgi:hypothetical protein
MKLLFRVFMFLVLALASSAAMAAELTQALTAEEVACNEKQLERLLQRMKAGKEIYWPLPQLPTTLLVSYSNAAGFFDGLLATSQYFRVDIGQVPPEQAVEHYLAFNLNPSVRSLLLNPARPELAQVGLNREQSSSNLVEPGGYYDLTLELDPTLGGGDSLVINNFAEPPAGEPYNGFLGNSTKPGRGLIADGLLKPCHGKLTDFDRHVFSVLQRMVRGLVIDLFLAPDSEFSIFRGSEPHTYRINYYPVFAHYETRGHLAVEIQLDWTPQGKLTSARWTALPACTSAAEPGCTALAEISPGVYLIPPVLGGVTPYPNDSLRNGVFFLWQQGPSAPVVLDMEALLAHTTWNEPVW